MSIYFAETKFGFDWGAAKITRIHSEEKTGAVHIGIETPRHQGSEALQLYVTKTGKVRLFAPGNGEYKLVARRKRRVKK